MFKYFDSPIMFDEGFPSEECTTLSTLAHGELGVIWQESNGAYSAKVGDKSARHLGNSWQAFKWVIDNQPKTGVEE